MEEKQKKQKQQKRGNEPTFISNGKIKKYRWDGEVVLQPAEVSEGNKRKSE